MEKITEILGWCLILNFGLLLISTVAMGSKYGSWRIKLLSRWFGLSESSLAEVCFNYLGHYKVLIIVFNLVPYIALKIVA